MPIPLPDDRDMVRRIYEDASALAAALHRLWMESRRVTALRKSAAPEYPEAERRLRQWVESGGEWWPSEAIMRIALYLEGPSRGDTPEEHRRWFKAVLATLIDKDDSVAGFVNYFKQRALNLRDAAARKLNEIADRERIATAPKSELSGETNNRKGNTDKPRTIDDLTPTAWKLLRALRDKKASDSENAISREEIVTQACTGNANSKNVRDAFAMMKTLELIQTRKNVGTWVTEVGLNSLKSRR